MKRFLFVLLITGLGSSMVIASGAEDQALKFIQSLLTGKFTEAQPMISQELKDALAQSNLTLESFWNTLTQQTGNLKQIKRIKSSTEQGYQVVYVGCEFEKTTLDARIVFDKDMKIAGLQFVPYSEARTFKIPLYAKTENFQEVECTIENGQWKLPAILTFPKGDGPFAAVILVHGSGPNDRDETVGSNKPFRDLAWGLATEGIAVLRYDKRTKVYPQECSAMMSTFTVNDETIDDALAAIELLKSFEKIDKQRIFLLGHSLGATLAPRIATRSNELAGIILLAPAARGLYILNAVDQIEYIFSLDGKLDDQERNQVEQMKQQIDRIQNHQLQETEVVLGASKAYWEDLLNYDPIQTAKSLNLPILIMQGARDYQVTAQKDFQMWQNALKERKNVTFKLYPDLNHLFISGSGPSTPYEYEQAGNVDQGVIRDIVMWIGCMIR
ncbi:MAG: alpha/beta fold hydrolase [Pseudothermotoga sp.]